MPSIIDLSHGTLAMLTSVFAVLCFVFVGLFLKCDYNIIKDENGKPRLSKNGEIQTEMTRRQITYAALMVLMAVLAFTSGIAYLVK